MTNKILLFLSLSRTPHLLLDLAAPGLAVVLCLGAFPASSVMLLGLLTAFAGYTAVYALNDILDCRVDHETVMSEAITAAKTDLDGVWVLHPLARGLLGYRETVFWTVAWASLALVGAILLNPVCPIIFLFASFMEFFYCSLFRITWLRSVISGIVKTAGPVAAVVAVSPDPSLPFLAILFLWIFFWEIGGQNVPNDLSDLDADRRVDGRTIPVRFGVRGAILIIAGSLVVTLAMSLAVFLVSPVPLGSMYLSGALLSGFYFLLLPCYRLYRTGAPGEAMQLFNRACYYPPSMLLVTIVSWLF